MARDEAAARAVQPAAVTEGQPSLASTFQEHDELDELTEASNAVVDMVHAGDLDAAEQAAPGESHMDFLGERWGCGTGEGWIPRVGFSPEAARWKSLPPVLAPAWIRRYLPANSGSREPRWSILAGSPTM